MPASPTTLTRETRDRAVAALRRAHNEGRPVNFGSVRSGDSRKVCSCFVIVEGLGVNLPAFGFVDSSVYLYMRDLGFGRWGAVGSYATQIAEKNDATESFAAVADLVATFDVVDEAEAICRAAVQVPA